MPGRETVRLEEETQEVLAFTEVIPGFGAQGLQG